jgi:DNA-binding CsgD family transcriptional regulator
MQAFESCRALSLGGAGARRRDGWVTGIVDRAGIVHGEDAGFVSALQIEWPAWQGHRLPAPLLAVMTCRNSAHWQYLFSRIMVEFSAVDELFLMAARARRVDDALSDRERSVADRYAAGATYREIATALQLSPATVRTYLRNVFAKLGVNNKAQIVDRLR